MGKAVFLEASKKVFPKPRIDLDYGLELSRGAAIMDRVNMIDDTSYEKSREYVDKTRNLAGEKESLKNNPKEFLKIIKEKFDSLTQRTRDRALDIHEFEYKTTPDAKQFTETQLAQNKDILFRSAHALYELQSYMDFLDQHIKDQDGMTAARATLQGGKTGEERPLPTVSSKRTKPAPPRE